MLESTLIDEPENNDRIPSFYPFECLITYTFMLITTPTRMAVFLDYVVQLNTLMTAIKLLAAEISVANEPFQQRGII